LDSANCITGFQRSKNGLRLGSQKNANEFDCGLPKMLVSMALHLGWEATEMTEKKYWEDKGLKLYYTSSTDCSVDENGAKKDKKKATAPGTYVTDLQNDLIAAGYLKEGSADGSFGPGTKRAVLRFQRRAKNSLYRVQGEGKETVAADVKALTYTGEVNGICDLDTAKELRLWISQKLKAPLNRFPLVPITGGMLRQDAAILWVLAAQQVKALGGTIDSPYGDTTRSVTFRKSTGGNSLYSLHYTGRAVDLNQGLAGGRNQRYYVVKEADGSDTVWRIYCKTDKQDGTQGRSIGRGIKYYVFGSKKEVDLPQAYYLDLTTFLSNFGFMRIKAHSNWQTNAKGQEWWHFHYNHDLSDSFSDEMELVGITEDVLKKNGWDTEAKLDHKPG
jgi:hypothetical protein